MDQPSSDAGWEYSVKDRLRSTRPGCSGIASPQQPPSQFSKLGGGDAFAHQVFQNTEGGLAYAKLVAREASDPREAERGEYISHRKANPSYALSSSMR
jgi:hypothetical protein